MALNTKATQIFASFEEAEKSERLERWAMSPDKRLEMLEHLRSLQYPNEKTAPRLHRVLEIATQA